MNSQELSDVKLKPAGYPSQFLSHYTYVKAQQVFIGFTLDLLTFSRKVNRWGVSHHLHCCSPQINIVNFFIKLHALNMLRPLVYFSEGLGL